MFGHHEDNRKRNFAAMSTGATLSPSPVHFGDRNNNNLHNPPHYIPISNDNSQASSRASPFFERRRTSHPHNQPLQRLSEAMSNHRSQSVIRPMPSIIDLTDDADDRPAAPRIRERSHSHRPPQLGRSDAVGFGEFIDLTEDNEPDLIITGVQPRRRPDPPPPPPRFASPALFVPEHPPVPNRGQQWGEMRVGGDPQRHLPPPRGIGAIMHAAHDLLINHHMLHHFHGAGGMAVHVAQPMPQLDYQANAFAPPRKPQHVPPPEPRNGFTRSPLETDIIICPSCEEELVHNKDEEPLTKKGGKAPSRKEREEHPFWVVKECGHVYCNHCYQQRLTANKGLSTVTFPDRTKHTTGKQRIVKYLGCAVEGCESDVKSKDKWVGVFL